MKKIIVLLVAFPILFTSCVPQNKYAALETQQKETQELLNSATVKLNACLDEKQQQMLLLLSYVSKTSSSSRTTKIS